MWSVKETESWIRRSAALTFKGSPSGKYPHPIHGTTITVQVRQARPDGTQSTPESENQATTGHTPRDSPGSHLRHMRLRQPR
jgi:hypothetical protein